MIRWPRFISRSTMLPPIRPRPTIPISMVNSSAGGLSDCGFDCRRERLPAGRPLPAEGHAEHREPPRAERLQVAEGLRLLEDREAVGLPGDRHVASVVLDDLQEEPGLRAALVQLARGVEEKSVDLGGRRIIRSEEHTSELQSHLNIVCRLLL